MNKPALSSIFANRIILWLLAFASLALGIFGWIGWGIERDTVANTYKLHPPISLSAASLFFLCAFTLFAKLFVHRNWAVAISVIIILLSTFLFFEDLFKLNYGIEHFFRTFILPNGVNVARILAPPNTAFCFILLGICLLLSSLSNRVFFSSIAIILTCISGAIATIALLGYVLQLYDVTGWFGFTGMALHTSIGLVLLSSGIFLIHTIYSYQREKILFGPVFGSIFFVSYLLLLLWKGYNANVGSELAKHTQESLAFTADLINTKVDSIAKAVRRIVQRIEVLDGYSDALWEADAINYENDMPSLKGLIWVDENYTVQRIMNSTHFKSEVYDFTSLAGDVKALKLQPGSSKIHNISLPNAVAFVVPYFEKDLFKGALLAVIDNDKLISSSIPKFILDHYSLEVNQGSTTIFRAVNPGVPISTVKSNRSLNSSYVNWNIDLIPYNFGAFQSFLPKLFLIAGTALAVFTGSILYLFQLAFSQREKLRSLLKEKGDALAYREATINSANYAIICADETGVITEFNKAAEKMLKYSAKEMIGKLTPAVFHDKNEVVERAKKLSLELKEEIQPGFEVFVKRARVKNIPDEGEWTYIRKDGTRFPVRLSVTAVKNLKGELIGYMGIAIDMTELKKVENMRNELMAVTTHELRAPLGTIKGALDVVNESETVNGTEKQMLEIAIRNTERLLRLTNDILDIQKMEAGKMKFNFEKLNLMDFIYKAIDTTQMYAKSKQISLLYPESVPNITFDGDEDRLMQVMTNYISNAVKNSPDNSSIRFPITVHDGLLRVGVKDEGPGIPQEYQSLIFQKFSQLPNNTHRKDGTGLGLNITQSIIQHHHGTVGFDTSSRGTTFWFEIPLEFKEDQSPHSPTERTSESS